MAVAPPAPPTVTMLPAPAEIPGDPPSAPLAVGTEDTAVPAPPPDAVAVLPEADEEEDEELHERS